MLKRRGVGVIVFLALCLTLATGIGAAGAEVQSWEKIGAFIKLLNEAENYFLDGNSEQAQKALDKAGAILKGQVEPKQGQVGPKQGETFENLSTPEDIVVSSLKSALLNDEEIVRSCWSELIPPILVKMMTCVIRETIEEAYKETPESELVYPQFLEVLTETIYCKRTESGINSYYIWVVLPRNKGQSKNMRFKVIREGNNWKILALKVWEEEEFFKALLAEKI